MNLSIGNYKQNLGKPSGEENPEGEDLEQEGLQGNEEGGQEGSSQEGEEGQEGSENEGGDNQEGSQEGQEGDNKGSDDGSQEGGKPQDSSLNKEGEEGSENQPQEVNEDLVNKFLSERLGKEVTLDELTKAQESSNPLDEDPYLKELYEWRKRTNRPIEDFVKFQKDYDKVSDLDVAREYLQLEYPNSTEDEINLELRRYTESDDDLEEDVAKKKWELKKYATKGRSELNKLKADLGESSSNSYPKEVQERLSFAEQAQEFFSKSEKDKDNYRKSLNENSKNVEKLTLNLDGEKSIDYLVSEEDRKNLPNFVESMPHWKNEDGSTNAKAVLEDGLKIANFEKMIKLAYEQGVNAGADDVVRETKNVNFEGDKGNQPSQQAKKSQIEGWDDIVKKGRGTGLKIGKK